MTEPTNSQLDFGRRLANIWNTAKERDHARNIALEPTYTKSIKSIRAHYNRKIEMEENYLIRLGFNTDTNDFNSKHFDEKEIFGIGASIVRRFLYAGTVYHMSVIESIEFPQNLKIQVARTAELRKRREFVDSLFQNLLQANRVFGCNMLPIVVRSQLKRELLKRRGIDYDNLCGSVYEAMAIAATEHQTVLDLNSLVHESVKIARRMAQPSREVNIELKLELNQFPILDNQMITRDTMDRKLIVEEQIGKILKLVRPDERCILKFRADGLTDREIGAELGITQDAAKKRRQRLDSKLSEIKHILH